MRAAGIVSLVAEVRNLELIRETASAESPVNLSISASATHLTGANIASCELHELNFNRRVDSARIEATVQLNATHSLSHCSANVSWNPADIPVLVRATFAYRLGSDPRTWTQTSPNATLSNYAPISGLPLFSFPITFQLHTSYYTMQESPLVSVHPVPLPPIHLN